MESVSNMHTEQRPPIEEAGFRAKQHAEGPRNGKAAKELARKERSIATLVDRNKRLEKTCLELQKENAELRHAHKKAFAILREAH